MSATKLRIGILNCKGGNRCSGVPARISGLRVRDCCTRLAVTMSSIAHCGKCKQPEYASRCPVTHCVNCGAKLYRAAREVDLRNLYFDCFATNRTELRAREALREFEDQGIMFLPSSMRRKSKATQIKRGPVFEVPRQRGGGAPLGSFRPCHPPGGGARPAKSGQSQTAILNFFVLDPGPR
jgi:hypothetical protein